MGFRRVCKSCSFFRAAVDIWSRYTEKCNACGTQAFPALPMWIDAPRRRLRLSFAYSYELSPAWVLRTAGVLGLLERLEPCSLHFSFVSPPSISSEHVSHFGQDASAFGMQCSACTALYYSTLRLTRQPQVGHHTRKDWLDLCREFHLQSPCTGLALCWGSPPYASPFSDSFGINA
jgi:hypothetical protein